MPPRRGGTIRVIREIRGQKEGGGKGEKMNIQRSTSLRQGYGGQALNFQRSTTSDHGPRQPHAPLDGEAYLMGSTDFSMGILGGAFDPVHNGHLEMARAAMEEGGLDRVIFIPDHILICCQFFQPHGTAGVKFVGADTDLRP